MPNAPPLAAPTPAPVHHSKAAGDRAQRGSSTGPGNNAGTLSVVLAGKLACGDGDRLPVKLQAHQLSDNSAAPLRCPADFAETMRPVTGVPMGRATVAPDNTFAETVAWNGNPLSRTGVDLILQAKWGS